MMRIITGKARGVRLSTLEGENTRPTSERAKEAVFSMLQFEIAGTRVLDLFAGSGQMGLEALSRGAEHAVLCDASRAAVDVVRANALKTRLAPFCDILCTDFQTALQNLRRRQKFDLVFLDPPYKNGFLPQAIGQLLRYELLAEGAKLVCESADPDDVFAGKEDLAEQFEVLRSTRYGIAHVTVLKYLGKETEAQ